MDTQHFGHGPSLSPTSDETDFLLGHSTMEANSGTAIEREIWQKQWINYGAPFLLWVVDYRGC